MWIVRSPRGELRPFVETVWAGDEGAATSPGGRAPERMLPACTGHLVLRLGGPPIEVVDATAPPKGSRPHEAHPATAPMLRNRQAAEAGKAVEGGGPGDVAHHPPGVRLGYAVVSGARSRSYVRRPAAGGRSVGAVLRPGAAAVLLGAAGEDLAERHTRLDDLWGRAADDLHDRLSAVRPLDRQLDLFEHLLVARLQRPVGLHPAVAHALARLTAGAAVGQVVDETGYSHRRFNQLFRRSVGLPPKLYCRVARFQRLLQTWQRAPAMPLADLALVGGYSDQAHLGREFRDLAGITPGGYRAAATPGSRHVPLPPSEGDDR